MPALQSRKRRAQPDPDSTGESSPEPTSQRRRISRQPDDNEAYNSDPNGTTSPSNTEAVKNLIRLALACEYQRKPIRRADISDKVLGSQGRQFKKVFEEAQAQLRDVFGMKMVELPAREKVTVREKRAQKAASAQAKPTTSWILRTTLPSAFHDPRILPPSAAPTAGEEGVYTSIYTLLVSLISLSGGSLPEAKLERYLRRLGMEDNTPVATYGKTEALLKRLEKEGYLVKVKEMATAGEEDVSWVVGPRGKVEVGDNGVRGLAEAVYGELDGEAERELQRRIERSLGVGERERRDEKGPEANRNGQKKGRKRGRKRRDEEDEEEDDEDDEA